MIGERIGSPYTESVNENKRAKGARLTIIYSGPATEQPEKRFLSAHAHVWRERHSWKRFNHHLTALDCFDIDAVPVEQRHT